MFGRQSSPFGTWGCLGGGAVAWAENLAAQPPALPCVYDPRCTRQPHAHLACAAPTLERAEHVSARKPPGRGAIARSISPASGRHTIMNAYRHSPRRMGMRSQELSRKL